MYRTSVSEMTTQALVYALADDIDAIYRAFRARRDVFPHIRRDYLQRMIASQQIIFDASVIIVFQQYKRDVRLGDYTAKAGDYIIHQILNIREGSGLAHRVLQRFLADKRRVVLTVRASNYRARIFYLANGFQRVGNIWWKKDDPIGGEVYLYERS